MKNRICLISTGLLVILVACLFVILKPASQSSSWASESKSEKSVVSAYATNKSAVAATANDGKSDNRKRPEAKNPDLVTKYGESRVNLSRHIIREKIALGQELLEVSGLIESMKAKESPEDAETSSTSLVADKLETVSANLNLTSDQTSKTAILLKEGSQRKVTALQDRVNQATKDPTAMMTALLVSDAAARGEIGEPKFIKFQSEANTSLAGLEDIVEFLSIVTDSDQPLEDEEFTTNFKALLNPEQQLVLEDELSKLATTGNLKKLKTESSLFKNQKNLEEVNTDTLSINKMVSGVRMMFDGALLQQ